MEKFELKELINLLDKFHSDDEILEKIGGFQNENDNIISNAIDILYEVLEQWN